MNRVPRWVWIIGGVMVVLGTAGFLLVLIALTQVSQLGVGG